MLSCSGSVDAKCDVCVAHTDKPKELASIGGPIDLGIRKACQSVFLKLTKGKRQSNTKRNVSGETTQFQIYGPEATYDDTQL